MRFFKSFRLLHRRTKSESDIISAFINPCDERLIPYYYGTRGHKNAPILVAAASGTLDYPQLGIEFLPFDPQELYTKPTYTHLPTSGDILDAEMSVSKPMTKNLHDDVADLHQRMAEMRKALNVEMSDKQYHKCQADLRAEHIMELEAEVFRHKAIQSILARVGLSKEVLERALAADNLNDATGNRSSQRIIISALTTGIQGARIGTNSGGMPHPPDQYNAALNMTLAVRRELKSSKKISKFWKRAAQDGGQNLDTITPSPSNISSIYEPLSAERKKGVEELMEKRRLNYLNKSTTSKHNSTVSTVSSSSTILAPKGFENLPPLASESIKFELGRIANSSKISNLGSGSFKQDVLTPDVSIKSLIDTFKTSTQLRAPENQNVADAKVKFIQASPRHPSPNPDIIPEKVDKKRNLLMVSTRTFVSAVSASLRKSAATKRSKTQRLMSIHSRKNSDNDSPFDNSAFCDVTCSTSLTSTWPTTPITTGQLPKIPPPFEHGESLGHISEESLSSRNADSTFDTQSTPTTAATTPAKTPASKLPVLNYSRQTSPNVSPEKTPKKTYGNVTPNKLTRARSTSSPTLKERSAIPISTRQTGTRKYSLTPTSLTWK